MEGIESITIGFDFDGTIIDHTRSKMAKAGELGFSISLKETPSERIKEMMPEGPYKALQDYVYGSGTPGAPACPGTVEVLEEIRDMGFGMFIISRRKPQNRAMASEWIRKNIPGIFPDDRILFVEKDEEKDAACRTLGIGIYIDDKAEVLEKLPAVGRKYLYDPLGTGSGGRSGNWTAVASWKEFLEELKKQAL